jgi:hypothetical protein
VTVAGWRRYQEARGTAPRPVRLAGPAAGLPRPLGYFALVRPSGRRAPALDRRLPAPLWHLQPRRQLQRRPLRRRLPKKPVRPLPPQVGPQPRAPLSRLVWPTRKAKCHRPLAGPGTAAEEGPVRPSRLPRAIRAEQLGLGRSPSRPLRLASKPPRLPGASRAGMATRGWLAVLGLPRAARRDRSVVPCRPSPASRSRLHRGSVVPCPSPLGARKGGLPAPMAARARPFRQAGASSATGPPGPRAAQPVPVTKGPAGLLARGQGALAHARQRAPRPAAQAEHALLGHGPTLALGRPTPRTGRRRRRRAPTAEAPLAALPGAARAEAQELGREAARGRAHAARAAAGQAGRS